MGAVRGLRDRLAEDYSRIDRGSPYSKYSCTHKLTIDGLAGLEISFHVIKNRNPKVDSATTYRNHRTARECVSVGIRDIDIAGQSCIVDDNAGRASWKETQAGPDHRFGRRGLAGEVAPFRMAFVESRADFRGQ
jgi:hypothetical protein